MSVIARKPEGSIEQLQPGTYQAVCKGVFDIGQQKQEYDGDVKYVDQVIIVFEVNERMTVEKHAGERFNIPGWYTNSLHEKAKLRKDLENWRGRAFTEKQLEGFDLEVLVGVNCTLSVIETKSGKSKIGSISPPMKGSTELVVEKPFTEIPEWIQKLTSEKVVNQENVSQDPYDPNIPEGDDDIPF
jgi:hypothetical protein